MRITASNNNPIAFYRDKKYLYSRQCPSCKPLISVPRRRADGGIVSVPTIQLIYDESSVFLSAVLVRKLCDNSLVAAFNLQRTVINIKGTDCTFFNATTGPALAAGSYYLEIIEIIDGDPKTICSDPFCTTDAPLCFKLSYWNDCDSKNGLEDHVNEFFIDDLDFEKTQTEKAVEEKISGDNSVEKTFVSSKKIGSFNICGNDHICESLSDVGDLFDNVELTNTVTGEVTDMREISISDGGGGTCQYPITIEFVKSISLSNKCCDGLDTLIDPCPTDPVDPTDCDGYDIQITNNNGTLTYTETGTATSTPQWLVNGVPNGNGSSISLGAYGTYTIQTNCGSDTFVYNDPCANMSLITSANGPIISGSASGDTGIVITICNAANVQIGTGLPFTVPASEGNGFFTVKAIGDNCERQSTEYVTVEPEFECEHTAELNINNGLLTGSSTGCTGALDSEYIEIEDTSGNLTIVSTTNTFTPVVTGLYWYTAICNGCPKKARKLVIISDVDPDAPDGSCDKPFFYVECDKPESGTDTKVTLPK